jgi:ATP-binding cassette subfamily C protein
VIGELRRLYGLLTHRERRRFLGVLAVMLVSAVVQVAGVGSIYPFLRLATDPSVVEGSGFVATAYDALGFQSTDAFLMAAGVAALLLIVLSNFAILAAKWAVTWFQWEVNHSLSSRLLRTYLGRDFEYFLVNNTSNFTKNLLSEAQQVASELVRPALEILSRGITAVLLLALLFLVDPLASAFVLLFVGGGFGLIYLGIRGRMRTLGEEYVAANEDRYRRSQEAFGGIRDVKLKNREAYFQRAYEEASFTYSRNLAANDVYADSPRHVIEALAFGGLMIVLLGMIAAGRDLGSIIPLMGLFAFAGFRMLPAFEYVIRGMAKVRFNKEVLDIIEGEIQAVGYDPYESDPEAPDPEPLPFADEARFEDVTYAYPGTDEPAVHDVDLVVGKDQAVALVGETGAGKTTIVDLLLGFLEAARGQVLVDGEPLEGHRVDRWQRNLGYVPQDIYLTDDSIRRNIAFGVPEEEIDDEAVREAARVAHIDGFVEEELPDGYETRVGERGDRLSGGQRQRIGIARALYGDPDVLVLDEATSDIDRRTEASIAEAIEALSGEKTVVTIAHRLSTVRECDRVFVVEDGTVAEEGTFDELVASHPGFRSMVEGEPAGDAEATAPGPAPE